MNPRAAFSLAMLTALVIMMLTEDKCPPVATPPCNEPVEVITDTTTILTIQL